GAIETAAGATREASGYAQQGDLDGLTNLINTVLDGLHHARQATDDTATRADAYRQQIRNLAQA
ncbi:MAG: hypothetical protein ACRDTQ_02735, partial [Micromonosporaceae bacterium]